MMLNPKLLAAAVAFVVLACGGALIYGYQWGEEAATNRIVADDVRRRALAEDIEARVAERIAGIKVRSTVIRQEVEREVVERPVYRECQHSPDVLRLLNEALTGESVPAGGDGVPGADRGAGRQLRGNDDEVIHAGAAVPPVPGSGARVRAAAGG